MMRGAFSLLELAVALLLTSIMIGFAVNLSQAGDATETTKCVSATRVKLIDIRVAVERFARANDRLPMPAARNIASDHVKYGREASGVDIDAAGGVSFGALPWQALGLTSDYAGDCWGNKFTYAVTTALTTSANLNSSLAGNINLKRGASIATAQTALAYVIISHGQDGLGAVKLNWSAANPDHGWCSGSSDIAYTNCLANSATLMDAEFNNGEDAGDKYFDDLVVAAQRPKILRSGYFAYGWGYDQNGQIGDASIYLTIRPQIVQGGLSFDQVSTGFRFTCGLTTSGAAYCWGLNHNGQLGDNTLNQRTQPSAVVGPGGGAPLTFKSIGAGQYHACGLTTSGAAYCWGQNKYGQIGNNTSSATVYQLSPTAVLGPGGGAPLTYEEIAVGDYHVCGRIASGAVYCWGYNYRGQIGDNTNGTSNSRLTPTAVLGPGGGAALSFSSISAGGIHTCGLSAGYAFCWGLNEDGRIGDNTSGNSRLTPTAVLGPGGGAALSFSSISAGGNQTCALTAAGVAYCWGNNGTGQVGDNTSGNVRLTPTAVLGPGGGTPLVFKEIFAGGGYVDWDYSSTCGITLDGTGYCWGDNDGYKVNEIGGYVDKLVPTPLTGGMVFKQIAPGSDHTCGVSTTGVAYCWGQNILGESGNTKAGSVASVTPAYGGLLFTSLTGGAQHSCGLTSSNAAYCWGYNYYGQLGLGSLGARIPTAVVGPGGGAALSFKSIAAGNNHTCGLTTTGAAYCWGSNSLGQIGNNASGSGGTSADRTTPTAVLGPGGGAALTYENIVGGYQHTCARTSAGAVYCWGHGSYGQIGDNTTNTSLTPKAALGPGGGAALSFTSIIAGDNHTCGLTSAGKAYCWGSNSLGQIGDNTSGSGADRKAPTAVVGPGGSAPISYIMLTAGRSHTCGISTANITYCWGSDEYGQIGDNTSGAGVKRMTPTPVLGPGGGAALTFASISSGYNYTCGQTSAGAVYCWGNNAGLNIGDQSSDSSSNRLTPTLVSGSGTTSFSVKSLGKKLGGFSALALVDVTNTCNDLWTSGGIVPEGLTYYAYQSATPTGSCVAQYRTCTGGVFTGSYTSQTCTPGCDSRTITWGSGPTCTATMPSSLVGGASVLLNADSPRTGSVTVNCNTSGVITLGVGDTCS